MTLYQYKDGLNEFAIIKQFFQQKTLSRSDVILGIGDDAALLAVPDSSLLVTSIDTLVEGTHFLAGIHPTDLGYKGLAVSLSDLAAMGATPSWMMLALTLPHLNQDWLERFSEGLFKLADQYRIQLVGGNIARGPLSVTVQVYGVLTGKALCRHGAKVGDKIYISGTLGDAGLGLEVVLQKQPQLPEWMRKEVLQRFYRPEPRITLGLALRTVAHSAIDISDGLLADLGHILNRSHVGASLIVNSLPFSHALQCLPMNVAKRLALTAGEDYELCFTVPVSHESSVLNIAHTLSLSCCCIGEIEEQPGLRIVGDVPSLARPGFLHFEC